MTITVYIENRSSEKSMKVRRPSSKPYSEPQLLATLAPGQGTMQQISPLSDLLLEEVMD
jgi:hypothetical protein